MVVIQLAITDADPATDVSIVTIRAFSTIASQIVIIVKAGSRSASPSTAILRA
jgi:hypothetical protein